MDRSMYPNCWHPLHQWVTCDDVNVDAKAYTRTECPPKYYLIDFGLSIRYDLKDKAPLEPPIRGGDKSVPEFQRYDSNQTNLNPFFTDVYYVGNRIREELLTVRGLFRLSAMCSCPHFSNMMSLGNGARWACETSHHRQGHGTFWHHCPKIVNNETPLTSDSPRGCVSALLNNSYRSYCEIYY